MIYDTYNYSIHGVYKPTNISGEPNIIGITNFVPLNIVIFHTYVSLPEGINQQKTMEHHHAESWEIFLWALFSLNWKQVQGSAEATPFQTAHFAHFPNNIDPGNYPLVN